MTSFPVVLQVSCNKRDILPDDVLNVNSGGIFGVLLMNEAKDVDSQMIQNTWGTFQERTVDSARIITTVAVTPVRTTRSYNIFYLLDHLASICRETSDVSFNKSNTTFFFKVPWTATQQKLHTWDEKRYSKSQLRLRNPKCIDVSDYDYRKCHVWEISSQKLQKCLLLCQSRIPVTNI